MKPDVRALKLCGAVASIALTAVVAVNGSASTTTASSARGANTEVLCHGRGNGTFAPLSVSPSAVAAHLNHGDGRPLGETPDGASVFSDSCQLVANIAGVWLGESITFDSGSGECGQDLNVYRLTLQQSGSQVTGQVYWKILQSFYPDDVDMEQTANLTSGIVSGNTFTFSYGPPQMGLVATATFTDTSMNGNITLAGSAACPANTFELVRQ